MARASFLLLKLRPLIRFISKDGGRECRHFILAIDHRLDHLKTRLSLLNLRCIVDNCTLLIED